MLPSLEHIYRKLPSQNFMGIRTSRRGILPPSKIPRRYTAVSCTEHTVVYLQSIHFYMGERIFIVIDVKSGFHMALVLCCRHQTARNSGVASRSLTPSKVL